MNDTKISVGRIYTSYRGPKIQEYLVVNMYDDMAVCSNIIRAPRFPFGLCEVETEKGDMLHVNMVLNRFQIANMFDWEETGESLGDEAMETIRRGLAEACGYLGSEDEICIPADTLKAFDVFESVEYKAVEAKLERSEHNQATLLSTFKQVEEEMEALKAEKEKILRDKKGEVVVVDTPKSVAQMIKEAFALIEERPEQAKCRLAAALLLCEEGGELYDFIKRRA